MTIDNERLSREFSYYRHIQAIIAKSITDEMNVSKGDFITLTHSEALELSNRAAKRFLNHLTNNHDPKREEGIRP